MIEIRTSPIGADQLEPRVSVELQHAGELSPPKRARLSSDAVVEAVEQLAGSRDVTMTVYMDGSDERLMVAVDGSRAFLGLERTDGLFQFALDEVAGRQLSTMRFTVGGQDTDIETRLLVDLPTAAVVAREWLEAGESSSRGSWERC